MFYVGKGTEFKKENCKEYKTIKNAMTAAAKDDALTVWDETGKVVGSLTDNVKEGALDTNSDGSVNTYDENGNKTGTISAEEAAAITGNTGGDQTGSGELYTASTEEPQTNGTGEGGGNSHQTPENGQNGAGNEPHEAGNTGGDDDKAAGQQPSGVIFPDERMKVTVICDETLNLRRTPAWVNENICGRAAKGQYYYVKAIHTVEGRKMVQTIDDIYLSGESDHVKIEKV